MTIRDDAWAALNQGQYDRAEGLFEELLDTEPETALTGLGRLYLKQGKNAEALDCAETLIERNQSGIALGLYAEALGALGRRKEAEDWLLLAIEKSPRDGYLRVLLGEQRIRRGRWDQGASEIIAGLGMPDRDRAFQHVKKVFADLTEAVAASKVRAEEAQKFVNKIDYNLAGKNQEMAAFFGGVRRALNARQRLPHELMNEPRQAVPVRRGNARPPQQPAQPRQQPQSQRSQQATRGSSTVREYSLAPDSPAVPKRSRQSEEPELLALMRHDRLLNEALQSEIAPTVLPIWPSNEKALDPIPALRPQLLGYDGNPIKQAQLHMTSGSVASEISINRAVVLLLAAAARGSSRAPTFSLRGLTQLETQCWDGLLDGLPPVPAVYYGTDHQVDEKELALGAFIGRCATLGNATWRFAENPTDSTITLGKTVVQPFKVARAWLQAAHPDEVYLEEPVEQLLQAAGDSFQLAAVIDDTTFELTEKALNLRLAELWMGFRSHPAEVSQVQIASDIQMIEDADDWIVFGLDERWAPVIARGPKDLAKLDRSTVPIAYRRMDGLFLILASRKHFGRFLEGEFEAITPQNAPRILELVQKYHRNGANVVRAEDALSRDRHGGTHLSFEIHTSAGVEQRRISHNPDDPIAWRFR